MYGKSFRFGLILIAAAASGQTPAAVEKTFRFANAERVQDFQQVSNAIRAIAEIQQASLDAESKTLSLRGSSAQISMAEWLFRILDHPSPMPSAKLEYAMSGTANELMRVFHAHHTNSPQELQEVVNAVRSVGEIQRVVVVNRTKAFVLRGTDVQVAHAQWLIEALDRSPGGGPYASQKHTLASPEYRMRDGSPSVAQVFYPAHVVSPQQRQESVNMIRSLAELQRVVAVNSVGAIVARGTADQVALAEWLLNALATPPVAAAPMLTLQPGLESRMVYLSHAPSPDAVLKVVSQVRTQAKVQRLVFINLALVFAMRATAEQLAEAERLIRRADQSPAR